MLHITDPNVGIHISITQYKQNVDMGNNIAYYETISGYIYS